MTETHVHVRIGAERYAIPAGRVLEVADLVDLTAVPGAPSAVIGVSNLRGTILSVVDLGMILEVPTGQDHQVILVVRYEQTLVGLAVSGVIGVEELPPPSEPARSPHLAGAILLDGAMVGVISVDSVIEAAGDAHARV